MENKIELKQVIIGYNEQVIEHRDAEGKLLYTEHLKEPIIETKEDIIPLTKTEIKQTKIYQLKSWFDNIYRCQVEQATRAQYLQQEYSYVDTFRNKTYTSLMDLYREGSIVQNEIRSLM